MAAERKTERKMNFYESIYNLASVMPSEKSRKALLVALLDYFFQGTEPDRLTDTERKAFEAVRGRVDASRTNRDNRLGKKGGSDEEGTGDDAALSYGTGNGCGNGCGNETDNETGNETDNEHADSMRTDKAPSPSLTPIHSGVGVQGEGFEPPTVEEAEAYFAANLLRGDPREFHDHFAAQGWVRANGIPVGDWRALARQWSGRQRQLDTERAARGEPPDGGRWEPARVDTEADLGADERAFFEKYGHWPGEG